MPITIFYSWQSDLPNNLNRGLIRHALDDAVGKINADLAVEDAIRIDQDNFVDGIGSSFYACLRQKISGPKSISKTVRFA